MFSDEFLEISRELQKHHAIFHKFWKLGNPIFTDKVKTAAVEFDKLGECINFYLNEKFWKTLTLEQKQFVIAHECLHVLFYHGVRAALVDPKSRKMANLAMDVVVNHTLEDNFDFDRKAIDPNGNYCWIDTVFKDVKPSPPIGKSFEYYFNLLKQNPPEEPESGEGQPEPQGGKGEQKQGSGDQLVDDHEFLESFNNQEFEEQVQDILNNYDTDKLPELIEKETKDIEQQIKQAGLTPGQIAKLAVLVKRVIKKKWETVIKRWTQKFNFDKEEEQWVRKSRRMESMPSDLMLPSEQEVEFEEKNRIRVAFFQDTSGSCAHLADRFFAAASSLDPTRFDVDMYCFDTQVYPTTLASKKLYGFGGTTFTCIENYIQNDCKQKGKRYPAAVFVITDGYGDRVFPEQPDKWYWFLSHDYKDCIPNTCNTFMLKDFE